MDVRTLDGVLSEQECAALVAEAEATGFDDAPITTSMGFVMVPEVRNNTRVMVDDEPRAQWLWERMRSWIPGEHRGARAVGLNERLRYYRYRPGQYFEWHLDGSFRRSFEELSMLTLMVYLSDGFTGGSTEFLNAAPVVPKVGMAVAFDHHMRHRGAPVLAGTKYVLRTDVMYRRIATAVPGRGPRQGGMMRA
jgi:prolyl 4-hydroxylase